MKRNHITIAGLLAALCLFLPIGSSANPDPTLLGFNWWVHVCKDLDSSENCDDNRKLMPMTRFGLHRDENNRYWLQVHLSKPGATTYEPLMELSIPIEKIELDDPQNGPPTVRFSFHDFDDEGKVVVKTMSVSLLRDAGQPTTGKSCGDALSELTKAKYSRQEIETQCEPENQSVVHWQIRQGPFSPASGEEPPSMDSFGPPGDGQGSGSDEPPR